MRFDTDHPDRNQDADQTLVAQTGAKSADQTRNYIVLACLAVGGALYGMHLRTAPAVATAADPTSPQATVEAFATGGSQTLAGIESAIARTQELVAKLDRPTDARLARARTDASDPFLFIPPEQPQTTAPTERAAPAKSDTFRDALTAAQQLKLQSIVVGRQPACLIDDRWYTPGQRVERFTIESIDRTEVILRHATHRFSLKMGR